MLPGDLSEIKPDCKGDSISVNPRTSPALDDTDLIRKTPGVLGGDARIRDVRIAVWMIVQDRRLGFSDEQILANYAPLLTKEDLDAVWQYFGANAEEIERAIRQNQDA
jgi:uncharacterized protein (DUF433 family)